MEVCTSFQTDNHASTSPLHFLQARCPSCRPTNSVKALKAIDVHPAADHYSMQAGGLIQLSTGHLLGDESLPIYTVYHKNGTGT